MCPNSSQIATGTIVEFDVDADVNFDFLVFRSTGLPAYQNDQSYRSATYWAEDTVLKIWSVQHDGTGRFRLMRQELVCHSWQLRSPW